METSHEVGKSTNSKNPKHTYGQVFTTEQSPVPRPANIDIMSGSLNPNEIHRRQHRREKRNKLRAQLAAAPAIGRAAIEAKLRHTYAPGCGPQQSKPAAHGSAPVPVTQV